jgi:hypothetical protein
MTRAERIGVAEEIVAALGSAKSPTPVKCGP